MAQPDDTTPTHPRLSGILEAALYATDLDAVEAFYGDLLGLERIVRAGGRHVFYRVGTTILLIFNPDETARPGGNPDLPVPSHGARGPGHVCFAATEEEIARIARRLQSAGVGIEADFRWPNGARSIYVRDPAGNSVEFADPRLWS